MHSRERNALRHIMSKRDKKQLANRVAVFLRQYARRENPGGDPNDRRYDREIEKLVKRLKPEELDRLLREGEV